MDLVDKILTSAKDLPTLPTVYSALCDTIANARSTADDVAKVISTDQASTLKILRIANSAFYGFSGKVETVSRAVMILGFNEVRNIVLASSIINLFSKKKTLLNFKPGDFWAHSIAVGLATRLLGQAVGGRNLENFFVAGILHDIGKLFIFESAESEFGKILTLAAERRQFIREAELEVLGMDHALIGSLLADQWKLPEPIHNAIRYHHFGMVGEKPDPMVASVHVGDILARAFELGFPGDDLVPQPNEDVWEGLPLQPGTIEKMRPTLLRDYEETIGTLLLS